SYLLSPTVARPVGRRNGRMQPEPGRARRPRLGVCPEKLGRRYPPPNSVRLLTRPGLGRQLDSCHRLLAEVVDDAAQGAPFLVGAQLAVGAGAPGEDRMHVL